MHFHIRCDRWFIQLIFIDIHNDFIRVLRPVFIIITDLSDIQAASQCKYQICVAYCKVSTTISYCTRSSNIQWMFIPEHIMRIPRRHNRDLQFIDKTYELIMCFSKTYSGSRKYQWSFCRFDPFYDLLSGSRLYFWRFFVFFTLFRIKMQKFFCFDRRCLNI